jgi:nucleoside-diphosphate-sugar epimerase
MKRKILLTGATGFLGSSILRRIISDYEVSVIVRAISNHHRIVDQEGLINIYNLDEVSIEEIITQVGPDIIIHCATDYGRKQVSPLQVIEANLILPLKLLYYAELNGVSMFVNTDTFLDKRINHYSLSKRQFSEWFQTFSDRMICVNMILEHFYGPHDDKTKFVSFVISELLVDKEKIDLTLGEQKRNFIYIDDVVAAFETVIKNDFKEQKGFYNYFVGSDESIAIKDFVGLLKQYTGNEKTFLNFGAIPYRPNEVMESEIDTTELKKLGWLPATSLENGLLKTITAEMQVINSTRES